MVFAFVRSTILLLHPRSLPPHQGGDGSISSVVSPKPQFLDVSLSEVFAVRISFLCGIQSFRGASRLESVRPCRAVVERSQGFLRWASYGSFFVAEGVYVRHVESQNLPTSDPIINYA